MAREVKNPERLAELNERRARQREEGVVAMALYVKEQHDVKERTRRLREERLAREAGAQSMALPKAKKKKPGIVRPAASP